jgi:hypothetical protein
VEEAIIRSISNHSSHQADHTLINNKTLTDNQDHLMVSSSLTINNSNTHLVSQEDIHLHIIISNLYISNLTRSLKLLMAEIKVIRAKDNTGQVRDPQTLMIRDNLVLEDLIRTNKVKIKLDLHKDLEESLLRNRKRREDVKI